MMKLLNSVMLYNVFIVLDVANAAYVIAPVPVNL